MTRKKKRARKRNPKLTYADKLARLKTVYTPTFRARKRFTPQQKAAITRQWKRRGRQASYRYVEKGRRAPPPKVTRVVRRKEMEQALPRPRPPKRPPRIRGRKIPDSDTTMYDVSRQPLDKVFDQIKRMQDRNEGARFIVNVPKTPDYPQGKMYTAFYNWQEFDDDEILDILEGYGDIDSISGVPIK